MKLVRWSGLAGFIVLTGIITLSWWLFTAPLIKTVIQAYGSEAVGAKVSVEHVALSTAPFGINLKGLTVADPEQPMRNLFEFKEAKAQLRFINLLMGQVVIDRVLVSGLKLNTQRMKSGALTQAKTKDKNKLEKKEKSFISEDTFAGMDVGLPSPEDIIKKEALKTEQLGSAWEALYTTEKTKVAKAIQKLPSKTQINTYHEEFKSITKGKIKGLHDLALRKKKISTLKKAIRDDNKNIKKAKKQIKESHTILKHHIDQLRAAPKDDWQRLRSKYTLDGAGATNITQLLFGETIANVSKQGLQWYEKVKPLIKSARESEKPKQIERKEGRFIHFHTDNPLPNFIIHNAELTIELQGGNIQGQLKDITHQPEIINRPMTLQLTGKSLDKIDALHFQGTFNHIDPKKSMDQLSFNFTGVKLSDVEISKSRTMPITMKQSTANVDGSISLNKQALKGSVAINFDNVKFLNEADHGFAKQLALTLDEVKKFQLTATAKGSFEDIDFTIKSDLDSILKDAAKSRLKKKQKVLEEQLKVKLQEKANKYISDFEAKLSEILGQNKLLNSLSGPLDKILNSKL